MSADTKWELTIVVTLLCGLSWYLGYRKGKKRTVMHRMLASHLLKATLELHLALNGSLFHITDWGKCMAVVREKDDALVLTFQMTREKKKDQVQEFIVMTSYQQNGEISLRLTVGLHAEGLQNLVESAKKALKV